MSTHSYNPYSKNWTIDFETPQIIYIVDGDPHTRNLDSALHIRKYGVEKFKNWKHFFSYILEDIHSRFDWTQIDCTYELEEDFYQQVSNLETPKQVVKFFVDTSMSTSCLDPVIFVTEDDSLLQWLIVVRKFKESI